MSDYKYSNHDDAYKEALRCINEAKRESATTLDLKSLGLTSVPPEIVELTGLTKLYLQKNQLTTIPLEIGELIVLRILALHENRLTAIPPEIGRLTELTVLSLHENQLTVIPPEIGLLTKLTKLYLSKNQLISIPPEIIHLTQLEQIVLQGNPDLPLPPEIIVQYDNPQSILGYIEAQRRIKKAKEESASMLSLSKLGLTAVPPEIKQLTGLTNLFLNGNQLFTIPPEICQLVELTVLRLDENQLTAVPPEIGQLIALTQLWLNGNLLTTIPPEIRQLIKLIVFALEKNQLTAIPPEIGQLTELRYLYIYRNQLSTKSIAPEICLLTKLVRFQFHGNPNLSIPPEILSQDTIQALLDYFGQLAGGSFPLNEAKLIFVGQGNVGKTSLIKRLIHNSFDESENQTKGINIEKWELPVNRHSQGVVPITLNIWDFGGQEIMHATHQFFFTKRSLYLLVLDARVGEDEGRVEYWLDLINSSAPDAPVLIIINKSDQHHLDINRRGLQEKHAAIRGFISTSARKNKGINQLKIEIADAIAIMPDVDNLFSTGWMRVKNKLTAMQANQHSLPYNDYKKLCVKHGVKEESRQTELIKILHDLGIVLNFNDDNRIRDTSVLNPNWVTSGIYALLNDEKLQKEYGRLSRSQLLDILPNDKYPPDQHVFLLEMMLKFKLAFELDRNHLLVPDLLSKEQPAFDWDDANALQFAYQYSILPHSILHRFMVGQNHLVHPTILWRTGVMLQFDRLTALVKADIKAATIRIFITDDSDNNAKDRRRFLYALRLAFADIHASISGTKPQEVVPIPGYPDAPPIRYQFLLELEVAGIEKQRFDGVRKALNVKWLLNGVSTPTTRHTVSGDTYINVYYRDYVGGNKVVGDIVQGDKYEIENITDSSVELGRRR